MADPQDPPAGDGGGAPPENTPPAEPPEDGNGGAPEGDPAAEVAKWRALARKHEARAKAGAAAERRLAELEEQDKSELQKAQESARKATERADMAERRALRVEVAARKGLSADQAKRLQGSNEEELEADADELLAAFKAPDHEHEGSPNGGRAGRAQPTPKLKPGAVPGAGAPAETDPAKLAAAVPRNF
jgi:hypothetical protein